MGLRTLETATGLFLFALLAGSVTHVSAQTTGTTGATGSTGVVGAANTPLTTVGPTTPPSAAAQPTTPAGQLTAANDIINRGSTLSARVAQMLDEARREADMIRVTCLNDKLTQVNANMKTAQARLGFLQKATDNDSRNHEFTVLSVLGQKFQALEQSANQCVGQDLYDTGPTKVTTQIDTSLLPFENSPASPPPTLPPVVVFPPDASPKG